MMINLLFDIDGTLLLSGGAGWVAMQAAFDELYASKKITPVPVHGRTDVGIVGDLFSQFGIPNETSNREQFFQTYLQYLPNALKTTQGTLLPGVRPLLQQLEQLPDVKLGLLTGNIESAAWAKLRHYEIDHHFLYGGFGEVNADRNLVAEKAFQAAQDSGAVQTDQTIVIGDTVKDVECARWINCRCIGVLTGGGSRTDMTEAQPDLLLDDLSDADSFVDAIYDISGVGRSS